jgi:uncharacterized membrane protein
MRAIVRQGIGILAAVVVALAATAGCSNGEDPEGNGGSGSTDGPTWCEVSEVLALKCQRCHAGNGFNGAPFPLVTYEDTQVQDAPGPRWQRMQAMVEDDKMPPPDLVLSPPAQPVTASEKALLLAWFEAGAEPVGGTDCPD